MTFDTDGQLNTESGSLPSEGAENTPTEKERKEKARKKLTLFQKLSLVWNIIWLAFYCFYCGYFIAHRLGNRALNYVLLGFTAAYFLLFVIVWTVLGRKGKRFAGAGKRIYKVTRKLLLLVNTVLAGGAIINITAHRSRLIVAVCSFIAVGNIVLNIVWLIARHFVERNFEREISSMKQFASGVKSLFKKGFEKHPSASEESDGADAAASFPKDDSCGAQERNETPQGGDGN